MKKPLFLLILLSFIVVPTAMAQKSKLTHEKAIIYKQVKIPYADTSELQDIIALGVEPISAKNHYVEAFLSELELEIITNNGFQYEVIIEDMQKDFVRRNKLNISQLARKMNTNCEGESNLIDYPVPTNFELGSMGGYFTLEEVYQEFNDMHSLYPNLISALEPISNFETFEGRNLYVARVSDNPDVDENEPEILYTAIHHAREPESISQLIYYIWYLLENYDSNPEVQTILNNTELYIVPLVNPDGYNYNATTNPEGGGYWRKNRRDNGDGSFGVDPNRNYGVGWGTTGISFDGNSDVYCGTEAFSEPENQAIKWLCENHEFKIALNNHTYSELLLFPYGYGIDQPTPDNEYYEIISEHMVSQNGYTDEISATLYPASGDSDDWMYDATANKPKIFSFTPEIGYSFWPVSSDIIPIAEEMLFLNLTAAHLVTDYALVSDTSPLSINTLTPNADFSLISLGLDNSNSFSVSLEPINNILSVGDAQIYTDMTNMEVVSGSVSYTLMPSINPGEVVEYKIVVDQGGFSTEVFVSKTYGEIASIFTDESVNLDNWSTNSWGLTTTEFYSSPSSITDSPNGDYENNESSSIELNTTIDLSGAQSANITFYAKWNIENDYDYVTLRVNGEPQCGLYTNMGVAAQIEGAPLYDGTQEEWVQEHIDLSDYLGQSITVSFEMSSDVGVTADGFYFDDFKINASGIVGVSELFEEQNTIACSPNPAKEQVTFVINKRVLNNRTELIITNELGQEVVRKEFKSPTLTIDVAEFAEGMYFYSFKNNIQEVQAKKLVIIH